MDDLFSGPPTAATGAVSSNTASRLTFASGMKKVVITNVTGKTAYVSWNVVGNPTVSTTVWHTVLKDGEKFILEGGVITHVDVYVEATSGFGVVGHK